MTHIVLNGKTGLPLKYTNRHGLITGQTGTGKSVTLLKLAEQFSKTGVPCFLSDIKSDLAAISRSCPTQFLDVFGATGSASAHGATGKPLSVSISSMGPDLMARALELTDTQAGVLEIAFAVAIDNEMPLHTINDLRQVLHYISTDSANVAMAYGQVTKASVGVIMRGLLRIEQQGGNAFFGARQFDVGSMLTEIWDQESPVNPMGLVSILQAEKLINSPRVYGSFLLWLLTELWDRLPEIGDIDKPRLVLFFDEAHFLFSEINPALLRRIEQTVRLIRSKGVGVYFVTQSADDVPVAIREQLAFNIVHDRAYRIGQAHVSGLTASGAPVNHGLVQIDLPECPLGALESHELPVIETEEPTSEITAKSQWARMGLPEILLLVVILVAIGLGAWGLVWLFNAGTIGKVAGVGIAVAIAGIMRG